MNNHRSSLETYIGRFTGYNPKLALGTLGGCFSASQSIFSDHAFAFRSSLEYWSMFRLNPCNFSWSFSVLSKDCPLDISSRRNEPYCEQCRTASNLLSLRLLSLTVGRFIRSPLRDSTVLFRFRFALRPFRLLATSYSQYWLSLAHQYNHWFQHTRPQRVYAWQARLLLFRETLLTDRFQSPVSSLVTLRAKKSENSVGSSDWDLLTHLPTESSLSAKLTGLTPLKFHVKYANRI